VVSEAYDLYQQGRAALRAGRPKEATQSLERAKTLEPEKASIREALGIAYFRLMRWGEAEEEFRKVIDLSPVDGDAHLALARTLDRQGRRDEARRHRVLGDHLRVPPG
jgi:Flp pilus assembly protein TadD